MPHEHKRVLALITRCRTGELGSLRYQCERCPIAALGRAKLRQSTLSQLPKRQDASLAGPADGSAVAGAILSGHFYSARFTEDGRARQPASLLPSTVRLRQSNDHRTGVGQAFHRYRSVGILRRASHLGKRLHGLQSTRALRRSRRRRFCKTDRSGWPVQRTFCCPKRPRPRSIPASSATPCETRGWKQPFKAADAKAWFGEWTVDVQAVGDGRAALKYLAPYVNRVAISNKRIVSVDEPERDVSLHAQRNFAKH